MSGSIQPESTERCYECETLRRVIERAEIQLNKRDAALAEAETLKRISDSQAHEAWIERDGALARLAEAEKALALSCRFGRADTIKLVEIEASLRAAEERAAQAERLLKRARGVVEWGAGGGLAALGNRPALIEFLAEIDAAISGESTTHTPPPALQEAAKGRAPKAPSDFNQRTARAGLGHGPAPIDEDYPGGGAQGEEK